MSVEVKTCHRDCLAPRSRKQSVSGNCLKSNMMSWLVLVFIVLFFSSMTTAAELRDQGRIFQTGDILQITKGTFSQTITTGIDGQLTRIQLQWNADVPNPAPQLTLSISSGGDPGAGDVLFSETIDPTGSYDSEIFTWELKDADLFFDAGEQFTFNFAADTFGLVIAANDPPGYPGGELFLDGELLPQSWVNDIAFITFVDPDASQGPVKYEVTISNLTAGQTFTPQLILTHQEDFLMFQLTSPASEGLESLAEGGEISGLINEVGEALVDSTTIDEPLGPGQSASAMITGKPNSDFISVGAMMLPTNDSFIALNRTRLPKRGAVVRKLQAYDAGTETNDESCAHIPGPYCGGEGFSAESGEGFVHVSDGIHGLGGRDENGFEILSAHDYDWNNPVAKIKVQRVE